MFARQMMISGLQKQQELLSNLILEIENKPRLDFFDWNFCEERTKKVANNLRKLRKIKSSYRDYLDLGSLSACSDTVYTKE